MLFNFSDKNHTILHDFAPSGQNFGRLVYPTCRFVLRRVECRLPLRGRRWQYISQFFHDDVMALFAITFSGGIGIVLFLLTLGLKAQKHIARGRASASPRANVPHHSRPASGKSVTSLLLRNAIFLNYRIKFAQLKRKFISLQVENQQKERRRRNRKKQH